MKKGPLPEPPITEMAPRLRRRILALSLLRALLYATVLVVLYYFLPVDEDRRLSSCDRGVLANAGRNHPIGVKPRD